MYFDTLTVMSIINVDEAYSTFVINSVKYLVTYWPGKIKPHAKQSVPCTLQGYLAVASQHPHHRLLLKSTGTLKGKHDLNLNSQGVNSSLAFPNKRRSYPHKYASLLHVFADNTVQQVWNLIKLRYKAVSKLF